MGRTARSDRRCSVLTLLRLCRLSRRSLLSLQHLYLLLHLRVVSLRRSSGCGSCHVRQLAIAIDGRAVSVGSSGLSGGVGGRHRCEQLLLAGRHVRHGLAIGSDSRRSLSRLTGLAWRPHLRLLRSGRELLARLRHGATLSSGLLLLLLLRHHLLLLPDDLLSCLVHLL